MKGEQKIKNLNVIKVGALLVVAVFCLAFLFSASQAGAQSLTIEDTGLGYASEIGLANQDIRITVAKIIRIIVGFLGVIALGLIIYAGWLWMSSEGQEEKIRQAKKIIQNAIIGLIIILSAFAIVSFIISKLTGDLMNGGAYGGPGANNDNGLSALGGGIIEAHYPTRNATDIARNTKIVVTFKEAMDASTIITGANINPANIKIYLTTNGINGPFVTDVAAYVTPDNKTFLFKPAQYLGSASEKLWYTVDLGKLLKKADGQAAFPGVTGGTGYSWSFEVGTFIDVTPPKIESVIPIPATTEPRNVVVQINFTEAIDPTAASGATTAGFYNIIVSSLSPDTPLAGNFYISNQYKTVEFLTEVACGINSCGNTVFCLPANKSISVLAKAASLIASGTPTAAFPYDGIVDMCDNSFDGNSNNIAEGPSAIPYNANNSSHDGEGDNFVWSFATNNTIDISAPVLSSTTPTIRQNGVGISDLIHAVFSKLLMSSSITTSSVNLSVPPSGLINYWVGKKNEVSSTTKQTTINIYHDIFSESIDYKTVISSGLKDIYQNCFSPCAGGSCNASTIIPSCCDGTPTTGQTCP